MDETELATAGLRYSLEGSVATVTLARSEARNAQTPAMWRALATIGARIPDEVRVVVVRGEGHSFSAGLDRRMLTPAGAEGEESVTELMAMDAAAFAARVDEYQQGFTWLRDPRFVSVAAVQGYAIGAGFQLALSCDLRVLADDAQLAMLETALGLVPDLTGTKPLVESVGYARALEICVTGRMVGATEAAEIGLAAAVVPVGELDNTVTSLTHALLAAPAGAVRDTKALLLGAVDRSLDEQRLAERAAQYGRFQELAGR
ncbi:MAG: enoyl-CoA hydratase/isomerase family protein [Nocardioides sp.]